MLLPRNRPIQPSKPLPRPTLPVGARPALHALPPLVVSLGFAILVLELFILNTRFFDLILSGLRIPLAVFVLLTVALVASGRILLVLTNATSMWLLALVGWCCVTTVLSTWRYNSFVQLQSLSYAVMVFLATVAFVTTPRSLTRLLQWCAAFAVFTALFALAFADAAEPRLVVRRGSYADPNTLGTALVAGMPAIWFSSQFSRSRVTRWLFMIAQVPVLWVLINTSSRGAFVALSVAVIAIFFKQSFWGKLRLVLALTIALCLFLVFASPYVKARLRTLFGTDVTISEELTPMERSYLLGDEGSVEARRLLLGDSIATTLSNPVFGVGPGNFGNERWREFRERTGRNIPAMTTHNTYTQLSSEMGVLGLFLFLGLVVTGLRNLRRPPGDIGRDDNGDRRLLDWASFWVGVQTASVLTAAVFLSLGYGGPQFYTLGLTQAIVQVRKALPRQV